MDYYYSLVFLLILPFQDTFKGAYATSIGYLMALTGEPFLIYSQGYALSFYETMFLFDTMFFFLSMFIIKHHVGKVLCLATGLSALSNLFIGYFMVGDKYYLVRDLYPYLNILYFEVIFITCFSMSVIYPWLKDKTYQFEQWRAK